MASSDAERDAAPLAPRGLCFASVRQGFSIVRVPGSSDTSVAEMQMFNIDDAGKRGLEALPETGMGFQLVEAMVMGDLKRLLVLNSEKAIDLSGVELSVSNDPAIILRNGIRIVELLKSDVRHGCIR